jgi:hypothetical protein
VVALAPGSASRDFTPFGRWQRRTPRPQSGGQSEIPTLRRLVVTQQETYAGRAGSTYPFWALAIFTIDVLVLYGLAAHGGRATLN